MMDEQELEQALRTGLERRAAEADVTVPVVTRARAELSRRRRTRWGVGAAAAAVVLVVGGIAVATRGGDGEATDPAVVTDPSTPGTMSPRTGEWRTEYWGGVAVDVPADWGYGGAPAASVREALACFPEASIGPDGSQLRRPGERGWVGRPISLTDVCASYPWIANSPQEEPAQPYVWLAAAVEPGVVEYANGYVEETIEVGGVAVTVASDDAALREEVLASAREEQICPPERDRVPQGRREHSVEGTGTLREATLCAYRRSAGGGYLLSYAAALDEATMVATWLALDNAPAMRAYPGCATEDEFVVVSSVFNDPYSTRQDLRLHWDAVYRPGCGYADAGPRLLEGDQKLVRLTDRLTAPWSGNGVRAVLFSFIGPQG